MKLIKLSYTHYIIVDDSEIKEGNSFIDMLDPIVRVCEKTYISGKISSSLYTHDLKFCKKVTHSTQLSKNTKLLCLSEVEEAIYGYSVKSEWNKLHYSSKHNGNSRSFGEGFKAHQELVKDKLFTIDDMLNCFNAAREMSYKRPEWQHFSHYYEKNLLLKMEWDIEIVNDKIKLL